MWGGISYGWGVKDINNGEIKILFEESCNKYWIGNIC